MKILVTVTVLPGAAIANASAAQVAMAKAANKAALISQRYRSLENRRGYSNCNL